MFHWTPPPRSHLCRSRQASSKIHARHFSPIAAPIKQTSTSEDKAKYPTIRKGRQATFAFVSAPASLPLPSALPPWQNSFPFPLSLVLRFRRHPTFEHTPPHRHLTQFPPFGSSQKRWATLPARCWTILSRGPIVSIYLFPRLSLACPSFSLV